MKLMRGLLIMVLVFGLLSAFISPAKAITFSYTSGFQVQNLQDAEALVTISYYSVQTSPTVGGTLISAIEDSISNLGSSTYFPIHAAAGFKGSVVISSSTALASIVNLHGSQGTLANVGNASYVGLSAGAGEINLPLLHKNNFGYNSWFSVQNTSATGSATVNVTYSDGTTAGPIVIKTNASYVFDQSIETHPVKVFSAKIISDEPIVAVVVQERLYAPAVKLALAYTGFDASETNTLMPLINANNYGYTTGVQIQNTGDQDTAITVTYTPSKDSNGVNIGHQCTETRTVPEDGSATFALAAFGGTAGGVSTCVKERFVGSAQITSNVGATDGTAQPVIAIVNQQTSRAAGAYNSFVPSRATAKVVLPLIMDRNYGWSTGFNLMNVGDNTVDVHCTFTGTAYTASATLAPGESMNDVQNKRVANRYVGSGTCIATLAAGQTGTPKINAVVNETSPDLYDNLLTYEGINITP